MDKVMHKLVEIVLSDKAMKVYLFWLSAILLGTG